jgi:hypothetical protein
MDQPDRERIDQIIAFHVDLLRFRELLADYHQRLKEERERYVPRPPS